VDDYERMLEVGILGEADRVELIHGEIATMSPIGGPHVSFINRTTRSLTRQIDGDEYYVQVQCPIRIPNKRSEPQPDLAIVRVGYDERRPPAASDIPLVIEVPDASLDFYRSVKLPLYASAGIPEAWLFNLGAKRIERHTGPQEDGYRSVAYAERRQRLASTGIPEAWNFDLLHDRIERYTDPVDGDYRTVAVAGRGETIASLTVPTVTFDVDAVFCRPEETDEQG